MNVEGYYNSLLSFIDKAVEEGFITPSARHIIVSAQTPHQLLSKLEVGTIYPENVRSSSILNELERIFFESEID